MYFNSAISGRSIKGGLTHSIALTLLLSLIWKCNYQKALKELGRQVDQSNKRFRKKSTFNYEIFFNSKHFWYLKQTFTALAFSAALLEVDGFSESTTKKNFLK